MSEAYAKIAEGLKLMAAGYEALASAEIVVIPEVKESKKTSVKEQSSEAQMSQKELDASFDREELLAEIRAVMKPKCKDGKLEQCQALLKEYGVPNLSQVPNDKLLEFKNRAEVL